MWNVASQTSSLIRVLLRIDHVGTPGLCVYQNLRVLEGKHTVSTISLDTVSCSYQEIVGLSWNSSSHVPAKGSARPPRGSSVRPTLLTLFYSTSNKKLGKFFHFKGQNEFVRVKNCPTMYINLYKSNFKQASFYLNLCLCSMHLPFAH